MKWRICFNCGDQVQFYAIEDQSKNAYCWPCWIDLDQSVSGGEEE